MLLPITLRISLTPRLNHTLLTFKFMFAIYLGVKWENDFLAPQKAVLKGMSASSLNRLNFIIPGKNKIFLLTCYFIFGGYMFVLPRQKQHPF